eukprot:1566525-Prymnesium_polylepis.1
MLSHMHPQSEQSDSASVQCEPEHAACGACRCRPHYTRGSGGDAWGWDSIPHPGDGQCVVMWCCFSSGTNRLAVRILGGGQLSVWATRLRGHMVILKSHNRANLTHHHSEHLSDVPKTPKMSVW